MHFTNHVWLIYIPLFLDLYALGNASPFCHTNLHSTIFRFVLWFYINHVSIIHYLHSTIFRFVRQFPIFCTNTRTDLHSTIFRFVRVVCKCYFLHFCIYIPLFLDLYYGHKWSWKFPKRYLHSTIFRFVQCYWSLWRRIKIDLHSTIFRFVLLKRITLSKLFWKFTFHYF